MTFSDVNQEDLLALIGGFYDAASEQVSWESALANLENLFPMNGVIFEQHDLISGDLIAFDASGLPEKGLIEWAQHYHSICPRLKYIQRHPVGTIGFDHKVVTREEMNSLPIYQEFLKPNGTQFFLSTTLEYDPTRYTTLAIQRSTKQGHASERDIALLDYLTPHIQNAFRLKQRLSDMTFEYDTLKESFHHLKLGVVVVRSDGALEFNNQSAVRMVGNGVFLSMNGKVAFQDSTSQKLYLGALRALSMGAEGKAYHSFCLPRQTLNEWPIRVDLLPLPKQAQLSANLSNDRSPQPRLLMLISDSRQTSISPDALLQTGFGLTASESRLALALAKGDSLNQYAERNLVALTTVRTHLANLRNKLGARTQADVVRLVTQLASPVFN